MMHAGKEIVQKSDAPESLNVLEEAKVAGRVKRAAASAVAAASVKAKLLADQEEREMQRLLAIVIDQQVISIYSIFCAGALMLYFWSLSHSHRAIQQVVQGLTKATLSAS